MGTFTERCLPRTLYAGRDSEHAGRCPTVCQRNKEARKDDTDRGTAPLAERGWRAAERDQITRSDEHDQEKHGGRKPLLEMVPPPCPADGWRRHWYLHRLLVGWQNEPAVTTAGET